MENSRDVPKDAILAQVSLGITWTRLWETTPSVSTSSKHAIFTIGDPGDGTGQEVGKTTPNVTTPPQDTIF
jgi:hypothetical protein